MTAARPPMGWNSWNTFGEKIDEELILQIADRMVDEGYREAGYQYLIIDDCWALKERDEHGLLVPDPKKFPHGMKAVADYVHGKGVKIWYVFLCRSNEWIILNMTSAISRKMRTAKIAIIG